MRTLSLCVISILLAVGSTASASWQLLGTQPVSAVDFFNAHQGLLSFQDPTHALQRLDDSVLNGVWAAPDIITGIVIQDSLNAWATVKSNGLFHGTQHWSNWANSSSQANLTLVGATPSRVFLYTGSQLYYTVDGSQLTATTGIPKGDSITAMDHFSDAVLLACSNTTVYRSTDAGVTWISVARGLIACRSLYADRVHNLAFAGGDSVRQSTDGGSTWTIMSVPPPFSWSRISGSVTGSHDCVGALFVTGDQALSLDYFNIRSQDHGQSYMDVGGTPPSSSKFLRGWSFDRGSIFWWWDTNHWLAVSRDGLNGELTDSVRSFISVQSDSIRDTVCGQLANAQKKSFNVHITSSVCTGVRIDSISVLSASGKITRTLTARTLYGDSMTVPLSWTPTALGVDAAKLRLWFHGLEWGLREHVDFPFTAISSTLPPVLGPLSDMDFETVATDSPKTLSFQISNTGCSPLRVDSVVSTNPNSFTVQAPALPASIQSGGNLTVSVTFAPQSRGLVLESIEVGTNAGHRFIGVQGTGRTKVNEVADDVGVGRFSVFPNPASTILSIQGAVEQSMPAVLYDLLGREVLRANADHSAVDVSTLPEGAYVIRIGRGAARIIIARP